MFNLGHVYVYYCHWIKNPHDKIGLCIRSNPNWFFWFNSDAAFHGHGQVLVKNAEHPAITKDCYLDLSGVRAASYEELKGAVDRGIIGVPLRTRILVVLQNPIEPLPDAHRNIALANLTI